MSRKDRQRWDFWNKLHMMSHSQYMRAQRLCSRYMGGWVRGINISETGKLTLNLEPCGV